MFLGVWNIQEVLYKEQMLNAVEKQCYFDRLTLIHFQKTLNTVPLNIGITHITELKSRSSRVLRKRFLYHDRIPLRPKAGSLTP
jgi:hypothetical protein